MKSTVTGKNCSLQFALSDSKYRLIRYNIYINDVPLFGAYGKKISGPANPITESFLLSQGKNKIEVSCLNERGTESYRSLIYAASKGEVKRDLYFLAFGVSKYTDTALNLLYADKDALDLAAAFQSLKGKQSENVNVRTTVNGQVTRENIRAARDFVKAARPDDYFVLFIAGHGLHDNDAEATYYFLTSNTDLANLKGTAADFESIESLLQEVPPRNKLFLMDACESGERDETEDFGTISAVPGGINSRGIQIKARLRALDPEIRRYVYTKDRYIYNDLLRRSGAVVFSSSKGNEFSFEDSKLENGLFTEAIIAALSDNTTDTDRNGTISMEELRERVAAQVADMSGGQQHPVIDRDNIYQKPAFLIGK